MAKKRRYSPMELAKALRRSRRTIRRWYREGALGVFLEPTWIGGRVFFRRGAVLRFLRELKAAKGKKPEVPVTRKPDRQSLRQTDEFLRLRNLPTG